MSKKRRPILLIGLVLLTVLLAAAVASAKSPAATADIPKINYVKGLILTQEAMEVDPARAQRGLGATLIVAGLVLARAGSWWRREPAQVMAPARA